MFNLRAIAAGAFLLSLVQVSAFGQGLGNSPYSRFGLGEEAPVGFLRNSGMAGLGVSTGNSLQINQINPALLTYNKLVTFEIAASSQFKRIENATTSQDDGYVSLRYLAFAFPISKSFTTSIGLKPYSSVNYQIVTESPVINDSEITARYLFQGSGGISEVYWANGFNIGKGLTAGIQGSFLFGTLVNNAGTQLIDNNTGTGTGNVVIISDRKTLKDVSVKGGLAYRRKLDDKLHLNLGFTYQYMFDFKAKQLRTISTVTNATPSTTLTIDTLDEDLRRRVLEVPHPIQFGISIDKNNWMLGADFQTQDWSTFSSYEGESDIMERSYRVSLGGEITPDPNAIGYFRRVTYRAGISYGKTPILINGYQVGEKQATFGFTLPTGRGGSVINMAFIAGNRGTTDNGLIKETFYRFELGLSLTDRWFQRRQID